MKPKIHLYAACWNDARQLPFFFTHYDPMVERYIIFDDGSTDGSLDLLKSNPRVDLRTFPRSHPASFVLSELDFFNNCWKESRGGNGQPQADWVIVCSLDEHLVHPDLPGYLSKCLAEGVTAVPALGFQMFTDAFPEPGEHLCKTRQWGVPDSYDCKLTLFSPSAIEEMNYEAGGHVAGPTGHVRVPAHNEVLLQHYQLLGLEYTAQRFKDLRERLGSVDRAHGWGRHYYQSIDQLNRLWMEYRLGAVDTSQDVWRGYEPPSWWSRLRRI